MLANFLNKTKPINFVVLLVFFFLSFLAHIFNDFFQGDFSTTRLLQSIGFAILFVFIFFLVNFIIVKNNLTFDNYFAFFFYTSLSILLLPYLFDSKLLILAILYFLVLRKIYSLRTPKKVFEKVFDAGFWLGILFILEPLTFMFLILLYFAIYIHKKLSVNTLIIPAIGFSIPVFLYFTYLFWVDKLDVFLQLFKIPIHFSFLDYVNHSLYLPFIALFIFTMLSVFIKSNTTLSVNNTFRRSWVLMLINFFLALFYACLHHNKSYASFIFILFPTAIILANGIELIKKNSIKNVILYLCFIGCILSLFFL